MARTANKSNGKTFSTQQSLNGAVKSICDVMRRSNCAGALQYVPELTWILFLRILDEREQEEAEAAEAVGVPFRRSLEAPYRWRDWAAPAGPKRTELSSGTLGDFFGFVHGSLIPYLKGLKSRPGATARQKVISEIMSGVERVRIDTERNFLDVLDKVDEISRANVDSTHIFTLSQVYEGLLLAQAFEYMAGPNNEKITAPEQLEALKQRTFYGREKDNAIYPIALANLVLHGIDEPHVWHGNTLTGLETYGGLFAGAPPLHDVVLLNPPFGGKEGKEAQTRFAYKTSATQVLFLQHVINRMKPGGRCGIVLDEGVLFRTNQAAFVQTKRKLLDDCEVWCIVSLPPGVFTAAGAGVKTNLLFFTKGKSTERIWYYDLSAVKVTKKNPLTLDKFADFFRLLPDRAESERSWTVTREEIEAKDYDLKAVNPNAVREEDTRTPGELLDLIEAQGREVSAALARLRSLR